MDNRRSIDNIGCYLKTNLTFITLLIHSHITPIISPDLYILNIYLNWVGLGTWSPYFGKIANLPKKTLNFLGAKEKDRDGGKKKTKTKVVQLPSDCIWVASSI